MFLEYTYENILQRMLDSIPSDLDKREGSIIYNTIAPAALELARMYSDLDRFLSYTFIDENTPIEFIQKRASEFGINIREATFAVKKGYFYNTNGEFMDIPLGARFNIDDLNFQAIEKISNGSYKMRCESAGTKGNYVTGNLIPIDYIESLSVAILNESIVLAEDTETAESLYKRYIERIRLPSTSGNKYHYLTWAKEVSGVGDAKVIPLWNGAGSVKVVVVNSDKKAASPELVQSVYNHIENMRPIGALVTVVSAIAKNISITVNIKIGINVTLPQIKDSFNKALEDHMKELVFSNYTLSYARIGSILLSIPGVIDYTNLNVNGLTSNIEISSEEIPLLYSLELGVY